MGVTIEKYRRQLGDLGHVGLAVDRADLGIEAGGDPVEHHLFGERAHVARDPPSAW